MDKVYPTDLTDEQWPIIEPLIPPGKPGGRPRSVCLRRVVNTIFYLTRSGCQWDMPPKDLAKRSTANDYFTAWKADGTWQAIVDALRRPVRVAAGRDPRSKGTGRGTSTRRRRRSRTCSARRGLSTGKCSFPRKRRTAKTSQNSTAP